MLRLLLIGLLAVTMSGFWASDALAQRDSGAKARGEYGKGFWNQNDRSSRSGSFYSQPARPNMESYRSFSYQPTGINAGDNVVVTGADVRMMLGKDVVGNVPNGMAFHVTRVINGWLGAVVEVDGQQLKGWVWHTNVRQAAPDSAAAAPQEVRRFSYEPTPQPQRPSSRDRRFPPDVRLRPGIGR